MLSEINKKKSDFITEKKICIIKYLKNLKYFK